RRALPQTPLASAPAQSEGNGPLAASIRRSHRDVASSRGTSSAIASSILKPLRIFETATFHRRGNWLPAAYEQPARKSGIFGAVSDRYLAAIASVLVAAIFTRYDGWIIAFLAWSGIALALWFYRRLDSPAFWLLSLPVVAAPIVWFVYNSVCFGDWLYFA